MFRVLICVFAQVMFTLWKPERYPCNSGNSLNAYFFLRVTNKKRKNEAALSSCLNKPFPRMGPARQGKADGALICTAQPGVGRKAGVTVTVTMDFRAPAWNPTEQSSLLGQGSGWR